MARWYSANVMQTVAGGRRLWHMGASGDGFAIESENTLLLNEPSPPAVVGKDWHTLFRKKLNVAWLPADKVFFRVVHLPSNDRAELLSMVDLQMEKLSPLPVTHIVWTMYPLAKASEKPEDLQPVLVIIAARSVVEEFLGQLQNENFLADRLEAPGLEQLLSVNANEDGIWIFVNDPGEPVLVAWRYSGTLQNVTLIMLPASPERGPQLRTQLEQIAWAGELEGWLNGPLKVHLLASGEEAVFWEDVFKGWAEAVSVLAPPSVKEIAAASARRCANDTGGTNLLPTEFAARYHQQFVDRLWMRCVMAVGGLYILGVLFYFGMLKVYELKADTVNKSLAAMGPGYTNSLRDVAQIKILRTRSALKYAALDCWKAVAEALPDSMTIDNMYFQHGKFELRGTVVSENQEDLQNFNEALRSAINPGNHDPLFSEVSIPQLVMHGEKGEWSFNCTLKEMQSP